MNNHRFPASPMGAMTNSVAGSLDFALAHPDKKSAGPRSRQSLLDFGNTSSSTSNSNNVGATFGPNPEIAASLFDDWLSSDLQQAGFVVPNEYDDSSSSCSDSESSSSSSPTSSHQHSHSPILPSKKEEESPILGFASLDRDYLIQSPGAGPGIDSFSHPVATGNMSFFPDLQQTAYGRALVASANIAALAQQHQQQQQQQQQQEQHLGQLNMTPIMGLTPEAVQQAAAALNIPWSKSLEQAVLAQSLLASFPMAMAAASASASAPPSASATTSPLLRQQQSPLASMMPKQGASMTVAHDLAMDISPPSTPLMSSMSTMTMSSPSPQTPTLPLLPNSPPPTTTTYPTLAPATPTTPRLSILSSTQSCRSIPGSASASPTIIKATTYKSTYRSASLTPKRDRDFDDPPSVLEGRDLSEMDEIALKRAKNTDAARRSRHKKLIKMESLEQRVAELEVENSMFESKLNEVELERSLLADKDHLQQARIQELEVLLATATREQMQRY
ncbi:hypothetical protein EC991_000392 [Linnemannia zychae]|nr:hypothetical protein EC991_000392 [Linnemannia zychae]